MQGNWSSIPDGEELQKHLPINSQGLTLDLIKEEEIMMVRLLEDGETSLELYLPRREPILISSNILGSHLKYSFDGTNIAL